MLENVLSDQEITEVQKFIKNDLMKEAVKKVLLYGVYYNGTLKEGEAPEPMRNFALTVNELDGKLLSDEMIGQVLRSKRSGVEMVVNAYEELEKFEAAVVKENKTGNPAR